MVNILDRFFGADWGPQQTVDNGKPLQFPAKQGDKFMKAHTRWTRSSLRTGASAAACAVALALAPGFAAADISLVFGTYTSDKPSAMVAQIRPSLNLVSKTLARILGTKVKIRMQVVNTYQLGVDHLVAGKFDFMRLGPASYVMAKNDSPGLSILAMESKQGTNQFHGIIAVHRDSGITSFLELKGRTFAFGSHRSTLGRFFAQLTLMKSGIRARDLKRFEYLRRHDTVGMAVGSGSFDAGALEETTFAKLVARGVKIRALAKYANATRPWVAHAGLEDRLKEALRQALLAVTDRKVLKFLRFDGFLPGSDADYDKTRQAIAKNPLFFSAANPG